MFCLQLARPLKERFGYNSKELDLVRRAVSVEHRRSSLGFGFSQRIELRAHYSRPCEILRMRVQSRYSVCGSVLEIELMGELVKHNVLSVTRITRAMTRGIPGKNKRAKSVGRVSKAMFGALFPDSAAHMTDAFFRVARWVYKNGSEVGVVISFTVQKKKTRLSRDCHPHLIRQLQSPATLKMLLGQKYLDVSDQLRLIIGGETTEDRKVALEGFTPRRIEWLGSKSVPSPVGKKSKCHDLNLFVMGMGPALPPGCGRTTLAPVQPALTPETGI